MKASLPRMLRKSLRLDSTTSEKETFLLNYTLVDTRAAAVNAEGYRRGVKANLVSSLCKDKKTRLLLRSGARYKYRYRGNDGEEIATIAVTSTDCP